MLIVSTDTINGRNIEEIGLVDGAVSQLINFSKGLGALNAFGQGGELDSYTENIMNACQVAKGKLIQQAIRENADAIVGYRCVISEASNSIVNVYAYGTAVKFI
ncbi:MAG: heavy metal-binding domain-containing protein [Ruminococcus sp.]|nr:heavy metal-binding domain-containing protein [Ruminococcus sp.]